MLAVLLVLRSPSQWSSLRAFAAVVPQTLVPRSETLATLSAVDVLDEVVEAATRTEQKLSGKIATLQKQLKDPAEAEELQKQGDALVMMPRAKWHDGLTVIDVPDYTRWDDDGNPLTMTVELDPKKDFQGNAKMYFKKAGKITRALEKLTPMIKEAEAEVARWNSEVKAAMSWQAELASSGMLAPGTEKSVWRLHESLVKEGAIKLPAPPEEPQEPEDPEEEERKAFKRKRGKNIDCFRSPSGHEVVAGRSSLMNEHVSLKLAKGDMPWFHSDDGIPGSHVLIMAPWNDCLQEDVEFAAKIAAYHCKARDRGIVPVMYCEGGGVRKAKGGRTGSVTTKGRQYKITVVPQLPED